MALTLSPGIMHGLLVDVEETEGTGLVGDHASGATSLLVAAGGFRDAGTCRVNGNDYAYTRSDAGDTLMITPGLLAAADDGDPVESLGADGKPESRLLAVVDLDMLGEVDVADLPRAVIPGEWVGFYSPGTSGAFVEVEDTDYGYRVKGRPLDAPLLDGGLIDPATMESPSLEMTLQADSANIPDSTYTRVTWPSPFDWHFPFFARPVMVAGPFLGTVEVVKPGRYIVIGTPVFVANSSGIRRARLVVVDPDGTPNYDIRIQTVDPPTGAVAAFQVIRSLYLEPGQCIGMEVMQTSGAGLALAGDTAGSLTALEVVWVATV